MTDDTAQQALEAVTAGYLRLSRLLSDVGDAQWRAGRTPVPREDTGIRATGLVNDPTPNITFDTRRIALRGAVIAAQKAQALALKTMLVAERKLHEALEKAEAVESPLDPQNELS